MRKPRTGERRKDLLRLFTFVFERFGEHELANHAAAGAYAFLLAATPALFLVIGAGGALLASFPEARETWMDIIGELFGGMATDGRLEGFFSRRLGIGALVFASISLVWAARLFIVAVQRGLRVVWGVSSLDKPVRDNIVTFVLEFAALLVVIAALGLAEALRFFFDYLAPVVGESGDLLSRAVLALVPGLILFAYAYLTYRFVPPRGPRRRTAALAALLATAAYAGFSYLLSWAIDRTHYDLLYGVFGGLVILLLKVFAFFTVYYHAAELAYILDRYDSLLFARFIREAGGEGSKGLAKALFAKPKRLLERYGRRCGPGEVIFREGEGGEEAYFLVEGEVGVYLRDRKGERRVSTIPRGELFGEVAHLLSEGRSATTKAEQACQLVVLSPAMFEDLLETDSEISRRVIDLLSKRLKEANVRFSSEGAMRMGR